MKNAQYDMGHRLKRASMALSVTYHRDEAGKARLLESVAARYAAAHRGADGRSLVLVRNGPTPARPPEPEPGRPLRRHPTVALIYAASLAVAVSLTRLEAFSLPMVVAVLLGGIAGATGCLCAVGGSSRTMALVVAAAGSVAVLLAVSATVSLRDQPAQRTVQPTTDHRVTACDDAMRLGHLHRAV